MKNTRTVWHSFVPWQFDAEMSELDDMSAKGWQLQSFGRYKRTYVRNDTVRYRYALDLLDDVPRPDYYELFRGQGWEKVCKCPGGFSSCWYVFRKRYDPALSEEEYRIYTDVPSLDEMKGRSRSNTRILIVLIVLAIWIAEFLQGPSLSNLALALWGVYTTLLWANRRRVLQKAGTDAARRRRSVWPFAVVTLLWSGVFWAAAILPNRSVEDCRYDGLLADAPAVMEMDITYPSWYTLDIFAYDGGSGVYTLKNSRDDTVSQSALTLDESMEENMQKVFLWPGTYTLTVDGTAGAIPGTETAPKGSLYYRLREGW